jgi:hypothetical protein
MKSHNPGSIKTTFGETKLFRNGDYPVLRGTAVLLDGQNAYFWTTGYVRSLIPISAQKLQTLCAFFCAPYQS